MSIFQSTARVLTFPAAPHPLPFSQREKGVTKRKRGSLEKNIPASLFFALSSDYCLFFGKPSLIFMQAAIKLVEVPGDD
jgi:hypothetical protein